MTDFRQETGADLETPPADAEFQPAEPLKTAGVAFEPDAGSGADTDASAGDDAVPAASARDQLRDGGNKLAAQATEKARAFADQGKARAGDKLDEVVQLLNDAAATVDDKIGEQYGQYARTAANQVASLSTTIRNKDIDELVDDVRGFVRASPAVAIGVAAAVGFALARVVQSGIEANGSDHGTDRR